MTDFESGDTERRAPLDTNPCTLNLSPVLQILFADIALARELFKPYLASTEPESEPEPERVEHACAFQHLIPELDSRILLGQPQKLPPEISQLITKICQDLGPVLSERFRLWRVPKTSEAFSFHAALHGALVFTFAHFWNAKKELEDIKAERRPAHKFSEVRYGEQYVPSSEELHQDYNAQKKTFFGKLATLIYYAKKNGLDEELFLRELKKAHDYSHTGEHSPEALEVMDMRSSFMQWVDEIFSQASAGKLVKNM